MKYLITGDLSKYSWSEARRRVLVDMGKNVQAIDENKYLNFFGKRIRNLQAKLGTGPAIILYNRELRKAAAQYQPEILWVDKGSFVQRDTLRWIKQQTNATIVNFNTDYLSNRKNYWRLHLDCLPLYDYYFTSNAFDVDYLKSKGVGEVMVLPLGYYAELFKKLPKLTSEEIVRLGADVGFIGHWEPATEDLVLQLLDHGLNLRVRGTNWHKAKNKDLLADNIESTFLTSAEYVKSIMSTKINLGINSTINRNQTSGRSCEIPAAGGFLLTQRTAEHESMYKEGKEVEFFNTADDIITKVEFYLAHEEKRKEIAANGQIRCLQSGTSFEEMMDKMTRVLEAKRKGIICSCENGKDSIY
jgi:spore maturation protein CgeB